MYTEKCKKELSRINISDCFLDRGRRSDSVDDFGQIFGFQFALGVLQVDVVADLVNACQSLKLKMAINQFGCIYMPPTLNFKRLPNAATHLGTNWERTCDTC
jgi:hypothetical protein